MENQPKNSIEIIQEANRDMLDYFNSAFLHDLEKIQELKTNEFEIDIKIDELEKTRDIYAFKTNSRKSVFTPIISDGLEQERSKVIDSQVQDLIEVKHSLNTKIHSMESSLAALKKRLSILSDAAEAIAKVAESYVEPQHNTDEDVPDGFEFIETSSDSAEDSHGLNILMQDAFDKAYITTLIDKNVKDNLASIQHKLDMLSYIISTDVGRARLILQELNMSSRKTMDSLDDICNRLGYHFDNDKSLWEGIDDFLMTIREAHPEIIIDSGSECTDYDASLHPVYIINFFRLINIFFDNIFKHSNANSVEFRVSLTPHRLEAVINDNGTGISADYLTESPWYSNLHKAHEIIYLLCGKLDIHGDVVSGTQVKFSYPVSL